MGDLVASLGKALLAPRGDGPREVGIHRTCFTLTLLASRGQRASPPSGKKNNERKQKTASLKVAWWNIGIMKKFEDCPQRRSTLVARELARLDIDIAAFAKRRPLAEDGADYTLLWSWNSIDERCLSGVGFMIKTSVAGK